MSAKGAEERISQGSDNILETEDVSAPAVLIIIEIRALILDSWDSQGRGAVVCELLYSTSNMTILSIRERQTTM